MIETYLQTKATIYLQGVLDKWGRQSFSTGTEVDCRWQEINDLVKDEKGNDIIAKVKMFLESDISISNEDRVIKDGVNYRVISVSTKGFIEQNSHREVLLRYE